MQWPGGDPLATCARCLLALFTYLLTYKSTLRDCGAGRAARRRCQGRRRHSAAETGDALIECSHRDRVRCDVQVCARFALARALGQSAAARARAARGTAGHGATTSCLAWPRLMFLAGLRAPPQFELGQLLRRRLFRHDWSSRSTPTIRQIAVTWRRQRHDNRREVGTGVVKTARL